MILCIIFFSETINCQNYARAALIFKDGTIIQGFGYIKKNKISFKATLEDEPDKWDGTIVKGIIFKSNEEFEYITIPKKRRPYLLRVIRDGDIKLYEDAYEYWSTSPPTIIDPSLGPPMYMGKREKIRAANYYLKRENEAIATDFNRILFKDTFKKILSNYFDDCDVIQDIIDSKEYKSLTQVQIMDLYNVYCQE